MEKRSRPSSAGDTEARVPAVWQVGDVILDQYEVTGMLGKGGMGTVYKVHHRGWNTDLAVKSPLPDTFAKAGGKENFIREAETWVNLGLHLHIVSCYYVRTLGGIPRVFAEYVKGGSLLDWIRTRRLYEGGHEQALERILDIAIQFAWGLHYAHEQGLVHQDVKPANVMMTPDGIAKVSDFGLAQARMIISEATTDDHPGQSVVVPGMGLMTRAYASPEQMRHQSLTRKTDIWSWGASVLELFAGGRFWEWGPLVAHSLDAYLESWSAAEDLSRMPNGMSALLRRCFQEAPADRPKDILEIAGILRQIYQQEVGRSYPREAPEPAEALADSLNNRALSLFDLGKVEEAKQVWERAIQVDPQHLETTYNRGIVLWRRGELTDDVLVKRLERVRTTHGDRWQAMYLLALVHLERGAGDMALPLLREAAQRVPTETEVQVLLKQVRSGVFPLWRCLRTFQGHTDWVSSVSLSADGKLAFSGSWDGTVRLWEVATGRCLHTFTGHTGGVSSVSLSADGSLALSGGSDNTMRLWKLDWELEARELTDWDKGARSSLDTFLTLHTSYAGKLPRNHEPSEQEIQQALTRQGKPIWTEQDFQELIRQLQYAGYGWLQPEGVRRKLEQMTEEWQRPPSLPGV